MHIFHTFVAIIAIILFSGISFILVLTYVEGRNTSSDPNARIDGRSHFDFTVYKLVLLLIFALLDSSQFLYILLGIILGESIVLFQRFYFNSPYFNNSMSKIWKIFSGINLWTAVCLICAVLLENVLMEGTMVIWIGGFPIFLIIILVSRDSKIDNLLQNINKINTGEELIFQVRYI